jgi:hypothetical protein
MNTKLREEIVKHIFANFAIIPSNHINLDKTNSLMSREFLLPETMSFTLEDNNIIRRKVWGCQISAQKQEVKILLCDSSLEKEIPEYTLIVQAKDTPMYGLYIVSNPQVESQALIACSLNGKEWLECPTYLQATFLGGMEQIREVGLIPHKVTNYEELFVSMRQFINFHYSVYGD